MPLWHPVGLLAPQTFHTWFQTPHNVKWPRPLPQGLKLSPINDHQCYPQGCTALLHAFPQGAGPQCWAQAVGGRQGTQWFPQGITAQQPRFLPQFLAHRMGWEPDCQVTCWDKGHFGSSSRDRAGGGSGPSPGTPLTIRDLLVTQLHCPQKHRAITLLFAGKPKPQWPPAGFWCWFMGQDRPCGCAVTAGTSPWAGRAGRWELAVPTRAISVWAMVLPPEDKQGATHIHKVTTNRGPGSSSKTSRSLEIKDIFPSWAFPSYPLGVFDCILQE